MCLFGDRIMSVKQHRRVKPKLRCQSQGKCDVNIEETKIERKESKEGGIFKNLAIKNKLKRS